MLQIALFTRTHLC